MLDTVSCFHVADSDGADYCELTSPVVCHILVKCCTHVKGGRWDQIVAIPIEVNKSLQVSEP